MASLLRYMESSFQADPASCLTKATEDYQREMVFFQESFRALQYWHFETCLVLHFSEWGNLRQRVCQLAFIISCNKIMQWKKSLQRWGVRCFTTVAFMSGDPSPNSANHYTFCTSWYCLWSLIIKTNFKGMSKKYLLSSALSNRKLAVVSMCRKTLTKTGFHPAPFPQCICVKSVLIHTSFCMIILFNKFNYPYSWFIRQTEASKRT